MKKPEEFLNVVNIPANKVGKWQIKHVNAKAGHPFETTNARTAIMGGHRGPTLKFAHPTTWHELKEGDGQGRWMSDLPIEQAQIDHETKTIRRGSVLVGGLGIGYVASILARRPLITRVCVVEKAREVLDLVAEHVCKGEAVRSKLHFVHLDLFDYLAGLSAKAYDQAYYDIWASDGEATFFRTVMPLLRLSASTVKKEPINWNESVMRGQLHMSLDSRYRIYHMLKQPPSENPATNEFRASMANTWGTIDDFCEPRGNIWRDWSVGFFRWMRKDNPDESLFNVFASCYAFEYGRRGFEAKWKDLTGEDVIRCELTKKDDFEADDE